MKKLSLYEWKLYLSCVINKVSSPSEKSSLATFIAIAWRSVVRVLYILCAGSSSVFVARWPDSIDADRAAGWQPLCETWLLRYAGGQSYVVGPRAVGRYVFLYTTLAKQTLIRVMYKFTINNMQCSALVAWQVAISDT